MRCRTCAHCAIINPRNGTCRGGPPSPYHLRWIKADGEHRVTPVNWIQLIPTYLASAWPPVNPNERGCRLHRLSLFTLWRWKFGPHKEIPSPVEQTKS